MREYPAQIEALSNELTEVTEKIEDIRKQIGHYEAILTLDIVAAKDEKSKPLYSNESLREAALTLAREQSEELKPLYVEIRELERRRAELFAKLERLRLEFRLFLIERAADSNVRGEL